jgi:hypothetical protein
MLPTHSRSHRFKSCIAHRLLGETLTLLVVSPDWSGEVGGVNSLETSLEKCLAEKTRETPT